MNYPVRKIRWFAALWWAASLCAAGAAEIRPGDNLVTVNLPAIPASLAGELRRYTESRSAGFAGWHPERLEMLVTTRFGSTAQLHAVAAPLGMRRQLTFFEEPVVSGGYDPVAGEFLIFGRDTGGNEFRQLYRYDLKNGGVTLLTDGGRSQNGGVVWSRRGDRFVYSSTRRNGADRDLFIIDPRAPESDRLLSEMKGGGWAALDWSPDDTRLILEEFVSVNESHLWLLEVGTGKRTELTPRSEKNVAYGDASFSHDGQTVYVTTDAGGEFKRLAAIDLETRETTFITGDVGGDVDSFALSDDGKTIAFEVNERGATRIYLLNTETLASRPVDGLPVSVAGRLSWHQDNRHLAINLSCATISGDVFVLDAQTGKIVRWTESELGGLVASELSEAELVGWPSFDGREITGFLFRPGAKFEGKRPVIINIHGGPEAQSRPFFQAQNNYLLNELGVALIYPNVRGSSGYGKTFVALDNGKLREDSVKDIGALIDWIARQPGLDASRVMVMGGSYGGYMTLACAVHYGDRLRCAMDVVGISNFVSFLENTEAYRRDLRRVEYGDERDPDMRAFLEQISPLNHAAKISKPMFIVQGANDPRVPRTEAVQMVETIRKNGGAVWYLEAKDEGHGFQKKENRDFHFYAQVLFTKTFLLGE